MTSVHTVGHGTLPADDLAALLGGAGIERVVDVRAFPGSRRHPQHGRDELERWLPAAGIAYEWLPALGGRRKGVPDSPHVALRNDSFRAYADHMEGDKFAGGVERLLARAVEAPTTVMCSESVWWRCHRRLLADHVVLVRRVPVRHLRHDGRTPEHRPTDGVRLREEQLVYDDGKEPLPGTG